MPRNYPFQELKLDVSFNRIPPEALEDLGPAEGCSNRFLEAQAVQLHGRAFVQELRRQLQDIPELKIQDHNQRCRRVWFSKLGPSPGARPWALDVAAFRRVLRVGDGAEHAFRT